MNSNVTTVKECRKYKEGGQGRRERGREGGREGGGREKGREGERGGREGVMGKTRDT